MCVERQNSLWRTEEKERSERCWGDVKRVAVASDRVGAPTGHVVYTACAQGPAELPSTSKDKTR